MHRRRAVECLSSVFGRPELLAELHPLLSEAHRVLGVEAGLDALFTPTPLEDRTGSEPAGRWTAEAAWGFPAFGGRFTASPHAGLGLSAGARNYTLGWRWTSQRQDTPELSFGLKAVRRESDTAAPPRARSGGEVVRPQRHQRALVEEIAACGGSPGLVLDRVCKRG